MGPVHCSVCLTPVEAQFTCFLFVPPILMRRVEKTYSGKIDLSYWGWINMVWHDLFYISLSKSLLVAITEMNSGKTIIKALLYKWEAISKLREQPTSTQVGGAFSWQASPQKTTKAVPNQIGERALALWDLKAAEAACFLPKVLMPGADHKGHLSVRRVRLTVPYWSWNRLRYYCGCLKLWDK